MCPISLIDNIHYIEMLTQAAVNTEKEIGRKYSLIMDIIEKEITSNQKTGGMSVYEYPNIHDIESLLRLDTGIYSKEYKSFKFLIDNYVFGSANIKAIGYKTKRGQNLQVSNIGNSIYSGQPEDNFYKLITSADLTDFGTHAPYRYLGNPSRNLQRINHGDIMFSATGQAITSVGKVCVFINPPADLISNINSFFLYEENVNITKSIFVAMVLLYYKHKEYIIKMVGRGNGGSFTEHHFNLVDIPNFPLHVRTNIIQLYYNPINTTTLSHSTMSDFAKRNMEWNAQAGIADLDNILKTIKTHLNELIQQIATDEEVMIDFGFLSQ